MSRFAFTKYPSYAFTMTVPPSADLLYDYSVRFDSGHGTICGAFVQFRATGLYAIVAAGTVRMIPQVEAAKFVSDTDVFLNSTLIV